MTELTVSAASKLVPSQDLVAREIEGELILVPLTADIGGEEDSLDTLYSLNDTGQAVWKLLDGRTLQQVADALAVEYEAPADDILTDVLGLAQELVNRRMLVSV